jgi:hypothetical protein
LVNQRRHSAGQQLVEHRSVASRDPALPAQAAPANPQTVRYCPTQTGSPHTSHPRHAIAPSQTAATSSSRKMHKRFTGSQDEGCW